MQRERELYRTDDLVAAYDPEDDEYYFSIFKITESIKKSDPADRLVLAMKYNRDSEDPQDYHSTTQEAHIEVSRILKKALKISEVSYEDDDGQEITTITISRTLLNSIEKIAAQLIVSSSEGEDASKASSEALLSKRKPRGKILRAKESASDDSESREFQAPQKPASLVEVEKVLAVQPTKVPRSKVEREPKAPKSSTKLEEISEKTERLTKEAKVPKGPGEPKLPKGSKEKKLSEYKRGKFNTRVKVDDHDPALDDLSTEFHSDCCDICCNREVIRAAKTGNIELLKNIIQNKHKITSLLQPWGTDDEIDAFIAGVMKNDEATVLQLLDELIPKPRNFEAKSGSSKAVLGHQYKHPDEFGLETIATGHNDEYAYGVVTRQVALGRGNREGINAMSSDFTSSNDSRFHETISNDNSGYKGGSNNTKFWAVLLRYCSVELFKKIISITSWEYKKYFAFAVRGANVELAAWMAEQMFRSDGWGLNELHYKSLRAQKPEDLGIVRSVNTKKKNMGNYLVMPIFCAAINPNFEVFQAVHENLDDNFLRDEENSSLIFYAAINSNPKILDFLLERGMEFREANKLKMTPLLAAAQAGRHHNVELLLKKGDITKKKNRDGYAAIHLAAAINSIETLEVLSRFNADLNQAGPKGMSALAIAAAKGHFETVRFLIQKGAKTIKKDKFKRTPLIVALKNCHARVASALVAAGCPVDEPDSSDNYPIHYACAYGCAHSIQMLIHAGANPNVLSSWKLSPIAAAMMKNHYLVLNNLLEYPDIDVNCKDDSGKTLLANSVRTITEKTARFVEILVEKHHANILIADLNGNIPLHHLYNAAVLTFSNIDKHYLPNLRNPRQVENDNNQKIKWFMRLAGLLSNSNLSTYCLENTSRETVLEKYFQRSGMISFNVLALIPTTQKYVNGKYEQQYEDLHGYLDGALQVIKSKSQLMFQILDHLKGLVAAVNDCADTHQRSTIVNELVAENSLQPEEAAIEADVLQTFRYKNHKILELYTTSFSSQYFSNYLRGALQMQLNSSVNLTIQELEYARNVMLLMKSNFISLVKIMIDDLGLMNTSSANSSSTSVKSCLLRIFSEMWTNLFPVPEDPSNAMNLLETPHQVVQPQVQGAGFALGGFINKPFGTSGFSFGQSAAPANSSQLGQKSFNQNQNSAFQNKITDQKNTYIDFSSSGVDKATYQSMKEFRNFQIREREELATEFLQMTTGEQGHVTAQDWESSYNFCSNIIQAIPNIFFVSTVNVLDLRTFNDPNFVKKSCEQMLNSIYSLGKKLITLADFGATEQKAAAAGTKVSLLDELIVILKGIWANLSAYKDVTDNNIGSEITLLEITSRAEFLSWVVQQIESHQTSITAAANEVAVFMQKKEEAANSVDRQLLKISRLTYQRSIKKLFGDVVKDYLSKVCFELSTIKIGGQDVNIPIDQHLNLMQAVFDIGLRVFKWAARSVSSSYLPYTKGTLMQTGCSLINRFYRCLPTIQSQIDAEGCLEKRTALTEKALRKTLGLLKAMWGFREKWFSVTRELLMSAVGKVATNDDIYAQDYKDAVILLSKKQVGNPRWNIISTLVSESLDKNLESIQSILHHEIRNDPDKSGLLNSYIEEIQHKEIESSMLFFKSIVDSKILTDHKIDRFSMAEVLVASQINWNDVLEIPALAHRQSNKTNLLAAEFKSKLYTQQLKSRIELMNILTSLIKTIYNDCFDKTARFPDHVVSALDRSTIDKATGAQIKITRDLEEFLQEVNLLPLERLLEELTYSQIHNTIGALHHNNYEYSAEEVDQYEGARLAYMEQLLTFSLDFNGFSSTYQRPLLMSSKILLLPEALASLLSFSGTQEVYSNMQVKTLNNAHKYESAIEHLVTLRSSFLKRLSHRAIRCFNLQQASSSSDSLLKKMFSLYIKFGWNPKMRALLTEIFDDFFEIYGAVTINLPNIKHPFFYLAKNPYFDHESWRKQLRVDVAFYDSVLRKATNLSINYTYTTSLNEQIVETLFSEGFKERNTNFLKSLLSNPSFESGELFAANHKGALHHIHEFVTHPEDVEFVKLYFSKVALDELIVGHKQKGLTPFLNYIKYLTDSPRNKQLWTDAQLVNKIVDIFATHGSCMNAEFDDEESLKMHLERDQEFPLKHLQKKNALQLLLLGKSVSNHVWDHLIHKIKVDVNHQDEQGDTTLHLLLRTKPKERELLQSILRTKIDPNIRNKLAETPVFEAIRNQDYDTVEVLHKSGALLDVLNQEEMSPLTLTIKMRNPTGLDHLIRLGTNLDLKDNFNRNSLHWAINFSDSGANSSFEIEEILIRGGVQVNSTDLLNRTPLHYPFVKINDFVVDFNIDPIESINSLMMNKELRVNEQDMFGNTPLHYAAQRGSLVSVIYLLDKGADINVRNIEGHNPFAVASIHSHSHLAVTLLSKNCDWNLRLKVYNSKKKQAVYKKVLKRLVEMSPSVPHLADMQSFILSELQIVDKEAEAQDSNYNIVTDVSIFQWAIRKNWQGLAYMLLSKGFEIGEAVFTSIQERKFNYTFTLLTKSEETQPYLFVNENGDTIVHLICLKAQEVDIDLLNKIFRVLLKKGLRLDQTNKLGHNSIHCAAICGSIPMINLLLERGVNALVADTEGRTPMMLAAQNHNIDALLKLFNMTQNHREVDSSGRNLFHHLCRMHAKLSDDQLLEHLRVFGEKVDINHRDSFGKIPLHYLSEGPHYIKSLNYVLQETHDLDTPDHKGQTILAKAIKHGASWEFVSVLINRVTQVNTKDRCGRTPIGLIVSTQAFPVSSIIWLISDLVNRLKLDLNVISSFAFGSNSEGNPIYKMMTPLDYLFRRSTPDLDVVATLLKYSARLDEPNDDGIPSFKAAILHSKKAPELLYTVLSSDKINKLDLQSYSVKLTQHNNPKYIGKEVTGICWLINQNIEGKLLKTLVSRGMDIYLKDAQGISPISFTISDRKFSLITHLLEGQALASRPIHLDISVPEYGQLFEVEPRLTSPLNYAIENRLTELAGVLVKSGASLNYSPYAEKPPAYYATQNWAASTSFISFLKGFIPDDQYEFKRVGLKALPDPNLAFKISLDLQIALNVKESVLVDPIYFLVHQKVPLANLEEMLNRYPRLNYIDPITQSSAFSLALESFPKAAEAILKSAARQNPHCIARASLLDKEDPRSEVEKQIPMNQPYQVSYGSKDTKLPLNQLYRTSTKEIKYICMAIELGADPNLQEGEKQLNLIMLAVLNNDLALIAEIDRLIREGKCPKLDPELTDAAGKSLIHMVISPHKNGSFENIEMLKILAHHYPLDKKDTAKFPPIYYASLQDSGVMLAALVQLGAQEFQLPFGVKRAPTSLISFAAFPNRIPEYEEDAETYLKAQETQARQILADKPQTIPIDFAVAPKVKATSQVAVDLQDRPFDVYMTKVDIKKGLYGGTVFYRMQLLHETNRDVYLVFTRYGRIGDTGQHQITSFARKEDAVADFCKIYKSKSNNEWGDPADFIRHKKKYKLVRFNTTKETEHIENFYETRLESTYPATSILNSVKEVLLSVVDSKILFAQTKELRVDISKLPLSKLNKTDLMQALTLLFEAKKLATDLAAERRRNITEQEPEKIFELLDDLAELTSEYYELIPSTNYMKTAPPPFESEYDINSNIMKVRQLLEVEIAVKILLGARYNLDKIHPIEYCYNCLNIKMLELDSSSAEKSAIMEYIAKSHSFSSSADVNIFALERKGEIERFLPFANSKNRKLLWHGSRTMNFLGILNKGLKIAPPEAPSAGEMFGKGIYFADTFTKSFAYTGSGKGNISLVLLCEVALGNPQELTQPKSNAQVLEPGFDSVMGMGRTTPDRRKEVVIPNGMFLPLGNLITREDPNKLLALNYNEYIVYNEDRVKIRYLVAVRE